MPQAQASEELDNSPTSFRLQHPPEKVTRLFDMAYELRVIDDHQYSNMLHFFAMRESFRGMSSPKAVNIGIIAQGETITRNTFDCGNLCDKYARFLREVPKSTRDSLELLASPLKKEHKRKMFYQSREIIEYHISILSKWLDGEL